MLVSEIDERVQAQCRQDDLSKAGVCSLCPRFPRDLEYCLGGGGYRLEDLLCILVWQVFFGERVVLHRKGKKTPFNNMWPHFRGHACAWFSLKSLG